jgi:hypothetical protein
VIVERIPVSLLIHVTGFPDSGDLAEILVSDFAMPATRFRDTNATKADHLANANHIESSSPSGRTRDEHKGCRSAPASTSRIVLSSNVKREVNFRLPFEH